MENVTPEIAMSWFDVVQTWGLIGILIAIVAGGVRGFPMFMAWLRDHTIALTNVHNELKELREDVRELKK